MTASISAKGKSLGREGLAIALVPMLTMTTFVAMVHGIAVNPFIPAISADLGTSVSLLGQVSAASMLLAGVLGVIAGPLIDRVGHRRSLVACLVVVAISAFGMSLAPSYLPLLLAALLGAAGRALAQPVALVIVGDRFEGDAMRRAVSWVMAGVSIAAIIGIPALTTIASAFDWRVALATLGAATAVLAPLVHRAVGQEVVRTHDPMSVSAFLDAYRPLLRHRSTVGVYASVLLGNTVAWSMGTYAPVFFAERHDYSTGQIGWIFFVIGIALFTGNIAAGGRVGTLPLRPLLIVIRLVFGTLVALLFLLPLSAIAGLALIGGIGLMGGIGGVTDVMLLIRDSPASRATTLTFNTAVLNLGIAFGGMVGGVLLALSDFAAIGINALLLSAAAALVLWVTRNARPTSATSIGHTS